MLWKSDRAETVGGFFMLLPSFSDVSMFDCFDDVTECMVDGSILVVKCWADPRLFVETRVCFCSKCRLVGRETWGSSLLPTCCRPLEPSIDAMEPFELPRKELLRLGLSAFGFKLFVR